MSEIKDRKIKTFIANEQCADHTGKVFTTALQMSREYKVNLGVLNNRLRNGMSLEEALTSELTDTDRYTDKSTEIYDIENRKWPSVLSMLNHWNIPRSGFYASIMRGESVESIMNRYINRNKECNRTKQKILVESKKNTKDDDMIKDSINMHINSSVSLSEAIEKINNIFTYRYIEGDKKLWITGLKDNGMSQDNIRPPVMITITEMDTGAIHKIEVCLAGSCTNMFRECNIKGAYFDRISDTSNVSSYRYMFKDCKNLKIADLSALKIDPKVDVEGILEGTTSLKSVIFSDEQLLKQKDVVEKIIRSTPSNVVVSMRQIQRDDNVNPHIKEVINLLSKINNVDSFQFIVKINH